MMKSILTGTLLLLFSYAFGQSNLSNAEYYINHDPGYGNATPIAISGDTILINEIINNTLEIGIHTFYIRAQNDLGEWGMDEAVPFQIREQWPEQAFFQIDYVEYYINVDPGFGMATQIPVSIADTILISEILTNNLSPGFNTLFIRSRNSNNQWGMDEAFNFYVQEAYTVTQVNQDPIVGLEYFIGDDPGIGSGIYVDLVPGDTLQIHEWLESQALTDTIHQLSIRLQSDSGVWSLSEWTDFEYLNCEDETVSIVGESDFCIGDSTLIQGPSGYNLWSWNTHQNDSQIYVSESGEFYVSVYDSTNHQCFLSDTLSSNIFLSPNASFTFTNTFNEINLTALEEGQNLFWQLNDEFTSIEASFSYSFLTDGWQSICLEASNICGVEEYCDSVLTCEEYETPPFWYLDSDGDGYGSLNDSTRACQAPEGFTDNTIDCDDNDNAVYPGAEEIPNDGIDQDCDGLDLVTSINEVNGIAYNFYPNPATNKLSIEFTSDFSGLIEILDVRGKIIISRSIDIENKIILKLENLLPGMYLVQLTSNSTRSTKQLIKQ